MRTTTTFLFAFFLTLTAFAQQRGAVSPARAATPQEAQMAILRYARSVGIGAKGRTHGCILDKRVLVTVLQQDDCEGARVFFATNDQKQKLAIVWPVDKDYQNMQRRTVYAIPVGDLCPSNCDFLFMRDDRFKARRAGVATPVAATDALRWIERFAKKSSNGQISSALIQKGAVLSSLINNHECFGIRVYSALETDIINSCVYLVGTDYYGNSDWTFNTYYADATNLCMGNCYQ